MTQDRLSSILNREALRGVKHSASVACNAMATTNVVNVSGRGVLESFGFKVTTTLTGTPVITFRVTIDGGTPMDLLWLNGSLTVHADMAGYMVRPGSGAGSTGAVNQSHVTVDNVYHVPLKLPHNVSALVAVIVGTAASAGAIDVSAIDKVPV